MEAIRIKRKITSDRLPELNRYIGEDLEIILLLDKFNKKENDNLKTLPDDSIFALKGTLKRKIDGVEFQKKLRAEWD